MFGDELPRPLAAFFMCMLSIFWPLGLFLLFAVEDFIYVMIATFLPFVLIWTAAYLLYIGVIIPSVVLLVVAYVSTWNKID